LAPALPPILRTERLLLRPLSDADAPALFAWQSDPEVARYVLWEAHRSIDDTLAFLRSVGDRYSRGEPFDWGIEHEGQLIGTIGLFDVRHDLERAEVGYALARSHWGRGVMREAVAAVVQHGFDTLGFRRVVARAREPNVASQRLLLALGFVREGTLREDLYAKGQWWTNAYFGLLVGEWRGPAPRRAGRRRQKG
jgi:ribosomal-protein-alanine N-acetyltransferase